MTTESGRNFFLPVFVSLAAAACVVHCVYTSAIAVILGPIAWVVMKLIVTLDLNACVNLHSLYLVVLCLPLNVVVIGNSCVRGS